MADHDAGAVNHGDILLPFLRPGHDQSDNYHGRRENQRHKYRGDNEGLLLDAGEIFPRYDSLYYSEIHDYASSVTSFMNMSFILGISSLNELTMMS